MNQEGRTSVKSEWGASPAVPRCRTPHETPAARHVFFAPAWLRVTARVWKYAYSQRFSYAEELPSPLVAVSCSSLEVTEGAAGASVMPFTGASAPGCSTPGQASYRPQGSRLS